MISSMHVGMPIGLFFLGLGIGALVTRLAMSDQIQCLREDVVSLLPLQDSEQEKLQVR
jgi:hypothetical protein